MLGINLLIQIEIIHSDGNVFHAQSEKEGGGGLCQSQNINELIYNTQMKTKEFP